MNDKIRGCLLGGAIGDSLGYQIEFKRGIREKQVTRFKDDIGTISDDTQMTLFTANALLWTQVRIAQRGISMTINEAVYNGYLDWLDTQKGVNAHQSISWLKNIQKLNKCRAPGNTCLKSLDSKKMGTIDKPINNSKGCGAVMRVAPYGIYTSDANLAGLLAVDCAAITHGNKLAWIPSYVCAAMISMLIHSDMTIKQALEQSLNMLENNSQLFYEKPKRFFGKTPMFEFMNLINKAIRLSQESLSDIDAIRQLGEGWTADEAFAIAVYSCLKYSDNFENAVVCAVNHDGDSDSTGAIAGNIIGAFLGLSNIPPYYRNNVELKDVILEIADDLTISKDFEFGVELNNDIIEKYINCKYQFET